MVVIPADLDTAVDIADMGTPVVMDTPVAMDGPTPVEAAMAVRTKWKN